jgi:Lon protease-like protein
MSDPRSGGELPVTIPIFPLTGVLLLPRARLPLNIFEPRYLAMTQDALAGERLIGMVQPSDAAASLAGSPPVFPTGCAGRITSFAETDDGRYLITLTGTSRFRIREELPLLRGYRRVVPEWEAFMRDRAGEDDTGFDRDRLIGALKAYFQQQQIGADWEAIGKAPGDRLVASIAMICPFDPSEKQALLEAPDLTARAQLLTAIVEMAVLQRPQDGGSRH